MNYFDTGHTAESYHLKGGSSSSSANGPSHLHKYHFNREQHFLNEINAN